MINGYCVQASLAPLRSSFYEHKVSFMPVFLLLGSEPGTCWLLDEDLQSKCVSWPNPNSMGWDPGGFLTCDFSFVPLILQDTKQIAFAWAHFRWFLFLEPMLDTRNQAPYINISWSNFRFFRSGIYSVVMWTMISGEMKRTKNWKGK